MTEPSSNAHKSSHQIQREIDEAQKKIKVGATYSHYKNSDRRYTVTGFGVYEATDELCVIYQETNNPNFVFVRPVSVWLEEVEWQGREVARFVRLNS